MFGEVLHEASRWKDAGLGVAIATVVSTWGSSPRPMGSQLIVDENGRFAGSVSGGCIEGAVIESARDVLKTGTPRLEEYRVSNDRAWEIGLTCGGRIQIFIEALE
ncbi:MAG: XdhC family protein [Hyphomicrobiales bacterium]|nr:XdhC family protein [Hyphomicrobiales bacterium]